MHSMVSTDTGVVIYGGATWRPANLSITDIVE